MSPIQHCIGFGLLLSTVGESVSGQYNPWTILGTGGVSGAVGLLAWTLLKDKLERSKAENQSRDKAEESLLALTRESVKYQTELSTNLAQLTNGVKALVEIQRESTNNVAILIKEFQGRPCYTTKLSNLNGPTSNSPTNS